MKFRSISVDADPNDEIVIHVEKETVRIFANNEGRFQIDRWTNEDWEKKLGAVKIGEIPAR